MGLPSGFLEIERKDRPYEKVEKRLKSWKEFVLPLPAAEVSRQGVEQGHRSDAPFVAGHLRHQRRRASRRRDR